MAAADMEMFSEEERLLGEQKAPRSRGRFVVLAAACGAAMLGFAAWHNSGTSPVVVHKSPQMVQLSKIYAKVRELKAKADKKADKKKAEEAVCDLEMTNVEMCGDDNSDKSIMCTEECVDGYVTVAAMCSGKVQKQFEQRLKKCNAKEDKKEEKAVDGDMEDLESEKCMPLVISMAIVCEMAGEPNIDALCGNDCQDAMADLHKECGKALGEEVPVEQLMGACKGCSGAILTNFGMGKKSDEVKQACGIEEKDEEESPEEFFGQKGFKPCSDTCKAAVCEVTKQCPKDTDTGMPGVGPDEINSMVDAISKGMKAGGCTC